MYVGSTFPDIKSRYIDTGKLYYVFKDFPIVELHPYAPLAAQAAECAGAQGRYWEMHSKLFARPDEWAASEAEAIAAFQRYAAVLELDVDAHTRCVAERDTEPDVRRNIDEARALGLGATPMFIINGKLLSGAHPTDVFIRAIDGELRDLGVE